MKLHLLVEEKMNPIPSEVSILADYQELCLIQHDNNLTKIGSTFGRNLIIEADEKVIRKWLHPFDAVWLGVGSPMMEQFEAHHIDLEKKDS